LILYRLAQIPCRKAASCPPQQEIKSSAEDLIKFHLDASSFALEG
jgi:hypothetical protein